MSPFPQKTPVSGVFSGGVTVYGYRHYTSNTGQFLGRDPIEEKGGNHLYAFVINAPTNWIDLYGLKECKYNTYDFPSEGDYENGLKGKDEIVTFKVNIVVGAELAKSKKAIYAKCKRAFKVGACKDGFIPGICKKSKCKVNAKYDCIVKYNIYRTKVITVGPSIGVGDGQIQIGGTIEFSTKDLFNGVETEKKEFSSDEKNIRVSDYVFQLLALFFNVFVCCCECQFDRSNKFIKLDPKHNEIIQMEIFNGLNDRPEIRELKIAGMGWSEDWQGIKVIPIDISRQRAHSTIRAKVVFKITRWALINGIRKHVVEVRQQTEMRQFTTSY